MHGFKDDSSEKTDNDNSIESKSHQINLNSFDKMNKSLLDIVEEIQVLKKNEVNHYIIL